MRDATNKNGGIKACMLEEGTAVGTNMREANKNVAKHSELEQEPLPSKSKSHGVIWASGGEEYDEDYDVYEHLDKVPITMPPPLGPKDFMYYPSQVTVFGTENKGPLRPVDQKPNMRGDPDYDALSPKQQEKRDWDQYYEYQEKVLAGTSQRKSKKPKIKTKVWTPTKPTPQLRADFGAELKKTTQQHHEKARAMYDYESPDPITQATYVPPEQKRDQDPPLKLTPPKRVLNPTPPTRVNITYQEGETIGESPQAHPPTHPTNFLAPPSIPPSKNNSLSLSFTQSSHSPVDNLLSKFKNTQFLPQPPPLPPTFPPMSLQNHAATSPFQPINSRASSPKTSTPNHTPPPIPKEEESRQESQYNRSASRSFSRHSRHGGSLSRNTCGSLNSSVYQAKIESLQEQVQTLLNQSAEKQDKLQRMESELEETKRQMKELINVYKQEQVKKTIQNEIPQSKRHHEKTHFEEERSQTFIHKPEPMRPQYTVPTQSHFPPQFRVPQKPPVYNFPPPPVPLEPEVKVQPTQFPGTPIPPTHHPAPVPTQFPPQPAPVEEKAGASPK